MTDRLIYLSLLVAVLLLSGCPRGEQAKPPAAGEAPRASVALRVLVVNEPAVAEAINRLRGEWAERSGGELSASVVTSKELLAAKTIDADAVVFPSRYMGDFCVRGWLRPVRSSVLTGSQFNAADIFPVVRELMKWGGQVMALPLGVDVRPNTSPSIALLVRAEPVALAANREGVLFDVETMKPRITDAAFVEPLSAGKATFEAVANGGKLSPEPELNDRAPVLGLHDRMVAVTEASRNAASAFKLIEWLASPDVSTQLAREGERLAPVRRSLASSPDWYEPGTTSGERADQAKHLEAALSRQQFLFVPRIPGVDEYVSALDSAVGHSVAGKYAPQGALQWASEKWESITNSHGRRAQRAAYLKHLGISEK